MAAHRGLIALGALLLVGAGRADTLLYNVTGYTPTDAGIRRFESLAFASDGRVVALDDADEDIVLRPRERIDGRGRFVLPGLIDAHGHLYNLGFLANSLDLAGTPSREAAVAAIAAYAAQHPGDDWILGRGWNQVLWPGKAFPTAADIDAVVDDRPVWLRRVDGHAGWANSMALALAGIDRDRLDPPGGRIIRDQNGVATGILIDKAMRLADMQVPVPSRADLLLAYFAAIDQVVALGLTGVHDAGVDRAQANVLIGMANDHALDIRVYAMLNGADETQDAFSEPLHAYGADRLELSAVKIYVDGALGSRGAALLEPYADDPENRGLTFGTIDDLVRLTSRANRNGFQVAIHAIGDRGSRMALDAFDRVQGGRPSPLRNRIEHAQVIAVEDIPRFAELGIIASMQPTHATSDMNMAEDRVGPERIRGAYAWRRLLDNGAVIAAGSDFPVESVNPFLGLYAAVTRKDRNGRPAGGWYADQAMTRAEALNAFTLAAAYAAHQEDRLGSLEPGKWADFIIVDRDYFEIDDDEIDDIRVLETWVGGERVYSFEDGS